MTAPLGTRMEKCTLNSPPKCVDYLSALPNEILLKILSYLSAKQIVALGRTCRRFRRICSDETLWRRKCLEKKFCKIDAVLHKDEPEVTWKRSYIVNTKWTQSPLEDPVWCAGYHMHNERCIAVYRDWIVANLSRTVLGVWNAKTGCIIWQLIGHKKSLVRIEFVPQSSQLVSIAKDSAARLWDVSVGKALHVFSGHTANVTCFHIHKNKLLTGSEDRSARLWSLTTGECIGLLQNHKDVLRHVAFDDQRIVIVAYDEIYVYDMSFGKPLYTRATQTSIFNLEYFDGIAFAAIHSSTIGLTLDVMNGQWISTIDMEKFTRYMCSSTNRMITGNLEGTIKLWDIRTGKCLRRYENANPVSAVALKLSYMISCCLEGDVFLFDYGSGQLIRRLFTIGYSWVRKFTTFVADDTKIVVPLKGRKPYDCLAVFHFDSDDHMPPARSEPVELLQPQLTYRFAKRVQIERRISNRLQQT